MGGDLGRPDGPRRRSRRARAARRRRTCAARGSRSAPRTAAARSRLRRRREREAEALVGDRELRVAAVDVVAGELRVRAQVLAPRAAVATLAVGPREPGHADARAGREPLGARARRRRPRPTTWWPRHRAGSFGSVSSPSTMCRSVRQTAAGDHPEQDLPGRRLAAPAAPPAPAASPRPRAPSRACAHRCTTTLCGDTRRRWRANADADGPVTPRSSTWRRCRCSTPATRRDLARIAALADELDVPAGRVLMRQGEFGHECFVILRARRGSRFRGRRDQRTRPGRLLRRDGAAAAARQALGDRDGRDRHGPARARLARVLVDGREGAVGRPKGAWPRSPTASARPSAARRRH